MSWHVEKPDQNLRQGHNRVFSLGLGAHPSDLIKRIFPSS
jgi:hypothetical protein